MPHEREKINIFKLYVSVQLYSAAHMQVTINISGLFSSMVGLLTSYHDEVNILKGALS